MHVEHLAERQKQTQEAMQCLNPCLHFSPFPSIVVSKFMQ